MIYWVCAFLSFVVFLFVGALLAITLMKNRRKYGYDEDPAFVAFVVFAVSAVAGAVWPLTMTALIVFTIAAGCHKVVASMKARKS